MFAEACEAERERCERLRKVERALSRMHGDSVARAFEAWCFHHAVHKMQVEEQGHSLAKMALGGQDESQQSVSGDVGGIGSGSGAGGPGGIGSGSGAEGVRDLGDKAYQYGERDKLKVDNAERIIEDLQNKISELESKLKDCQQELAWYQGREQFFRRDAHETRNRCGVTCPGQLGLTHTLFDVATAHGSSSCVTTHVALYVCIMHHDPRYGGLCAVFVKVSYLKPHSIMTALCKSPDICVTTMPNLPFRMTIYIYIYTYMCVCVSFSVSLSLSLTHSLSLSLSLFLFLS
jgi:hypothetical protein